jgi:hypothetical protein
MKNFAKLALFFTFSFVSFFAAAVLIQFLSSWSSLVRIIAVEPFPAQEVAEAIWKSLPIALYLSILVALSYTARKNMPVLFSIFSITILGCALSIGGFTGLNRTEVVKPVFKPVAPIMAEPGLILSRSENAIVLLKESGERRGPRVVSIPGQPLIYQEQPYELSNTLIMLPALPFPDDIPWFLKSMDIDFSLSAGELKTRLDNNLLSFAAYILSLTLLLSSLRFLMELSQWPLANLFICALVYRGILALEPFLG